MEVAEQTPYQMFAGVAPRLLSRAADVSTASQLGQYVSYVLHTGHRSSEVDALLSTLESARIDATSDTIDPHWNLPLTTALGMVRQQLHQDDVDRQTHDPQNQTLRERILLQLRAGVNTPTAIARRLGSAPTVISRVLTQLASENIVAVHDAQSPDRRKRHYVLLTQDAAASGSAAAGDTASSLLKPSGTGLYEPKAFIDFARILIQQNPTTCAQLQPSLQRIGMDPTVPQRERVRALGTALVIGRSLPTNTPNDCLALAEAIREVAGDTAGPALQARAMYEHIRASLLDDSSDCAAYLRDLDAVMENIGHEDDFESWILRGWVTHTRSLINSKSHARDAAEDAAAAVTHFARAGELTSDDSLPLYGQGGALAVAAREHLKLLEFGSAYDAARQALDIANSRGFLRIMAEANLWAGEAAQELQPELATLYLSTAAQQFQGLQLDSWRLFAEASLTVHTFAAADSWTPSLARRVGHQPKSAEDVIAELCDTADKLEGHGFADMFWSTDWMRACLLRRAGVIARRHDRRRSLELFAQCRAIYRDLDDVDGLVLAAAGVLRTWEGVRPDERAAIATASMTPDVAELVRRKDDLTTIPHTAIEAVSKKIDAEAGTELAAA